MVAPNFLTEEMAIARATADTLVDRFFAEVNPDHIRDAAEALVRTIEGSFDPSNMDDVLTKNLFSGMLMAFIFDRMLGTGIIDPSDLPTTTPVFLDGQNYAAQEPRNVVIKTDGSQTSYPPGDGRHYTTQELQAAIGGGYIEIYKLSDARLMVGDEEARLKDLPLNPVATYLYRMGRGPTPDYIAGDVLVCEDWLIQ